MYTCRIIDIITAAMSTVSIFYVSIDSTTGSVVWEVGGWGVGVRGSITYRLTNPCRLPLPQPPTPK